MQVQKLHFDVISGRRAYEMLFVEHYKENVPFEVKKTYFLFGGSLATASGQHCHYKEEEVFVCLRGSVQFITIDEQGQDVLIDMQPGDAVYVPNYAWHGFPVVGPDSVVVALSSEHYAEDRSDYLEDKQCFLDNKYYQKYKKQEINIFDVWNLEKKRIHGSQRKVNVKPGQIWMTKLGVNIGNEQNGQGKHMRPFLIIKKIGSLVFWLPLTTKTKKNKFNYMLQSVNFEKSYAVTESNVILSQWKTLDPLRCINKIGSVPHDELIIIKKHIQDMYL